MTICILNKAVGARQHLIIGGSEEERSFCWGSNIPDDAWVVGDRTHNRSVEELAKIFHKEVPTIATPKHLTAFKELDPDYENYIIPWNWVLPANEFRDGLNNTVEAASEIICALESSGYMKTYVKGRKTLQKLVPARTCDKKVGNYIEQNSSGPSTVSAIKSFMPNGSGLADLPVYSQSSTATGRLTVKKGPSILTLPAKCRDLIRTKHSTGRVVQVDFVSLEPRVAKYISGEEAPVDIYTDMCESLFHGTIDRKTAKLATLSALYGVSSKRLDSFLGPGKNAKHIIRSVRRYFGLERLEAELKNKMISNGHIENALGRPLFPGTTSAHVLVSHYIQSTAVDIALCGFADFIESCEVHGLTVDPLYVIHDAILIDVHEAQYNKLQKIADQGITNKLGHFPVGVSGISRS